MAKRDYYEVLEVGRNATDAELKAQYRKKALEFHPDRNPGDSGAEDKFKEASEAYEVLSNPDKRARYDRFGHEGLRGASDFTHSTNIDDIFSAFGDIFGGGGIFGDFFGGGSQRSRRRSTGERGTDIKIRLPLTLEEIAKGVEKNIKLKRQTVCDTCNGSGAKAGAGHSSCSTCNGSGEIRQVSRSMFGQFVNISTCPACNGAGQVIKEPCSTCHGEGRSENEDTVTVNIPQGVEEGNYMPVTGKGHAGRRSGPSGDLIVIVTEKEHKHFKRIEDNILYNLIISFPDAVLGTDLEVPTLYGIQKVRIEKGTQPGTQIRLKEKGIPHLNSYGKGDQVIIVNIFVPNNLSSKEKAKIKELAKIEKIQTPNKKAKDFFDKLKDLF